MSKVRKNVSVRQAIERIAGTRQRDNSKAIWGRAAKLTGLSERVIRGAWYGEYADDHAIMRLICSLADNIELRVKIQNQIQDNWELERETLHALAELRRRIELLEGSNAKEQTDATRANDNAVSALVRQTMRIAG